MSAKDNPAERLYRLLSEARKIKSGNVKQMLSKVLDVPEEPSDEFVEAVIQFYRLFEDVTDRLRLIDDIDEEIFIKPIERLRTAIPLTFLLDGWPSHMGKLSDVDMRSLRHAIHELRNQPFPPSVEKAVLDKLHEDVVTLYDLVAEAGPAEVPEPLRTDMLKGLWEILTAIRLHNVRGTAPLHHALLVNAGTVVTNYPLFKQYEQNEKVATYRRLLDRLWKIVPHAANVSELIGAGVAAARALLSDGQ